MLFNPPPRAIFSFGANRRIRFGAGLRSRHRLACCGLFPLGFVIGFALTRGKENQMHQESPTMANEHGLSLSYPNPSFSQMGCAEPEMDDRGCQSKYLGRPLTQVGSSPLSGVRQVIVMASCAKVPAPLPSLLSASDRLNQASRRPVFSSLDTSIVSTSLVTISHKLNDFVNAPWIILAYLLTYMGQFARETLGYRKVCSEDECLGFSVCISKLSDIYGRRNMLLLSWTIFMGFSLGCASAKDMIALYSRCPPPPLHELEP